MKKTPVRGTNDYLPSEAAVRDYLQQRILAVYQNNGFQRIMTPAIEDAENLDKSEGGENLNLIFKILKRGDKLAKALAEGDAGQLSDMGLRYDLTLPLSRYYANHQAVLMTPAKIIQIDKVYRAERPQKGRLREFVQCDIDILGSDSVYAEIELVMTTGEALTAIGLGDFKVKINDRRVLHGLLADMGFAEDRLNSVCVSFDKMDKIGIDGVAAELTDKGEPASAVAALKTLVRQGDLTLERLRGVSAQTDVIDRLQTIADTVQALNGGRYAVEFDISLVRGQGYYTGTVFEVESTRFRGALAGGGRYDHLIGKFTGQTVPAVGFSIGFERIFALLTENGDYVIPDRPEKVVILYEPADFAEAWLYSSRLRSVCDVLLYEKPKKTGKALIRLKEQGYSRFMIFGQDDDLREMD